MSFRHPLLQVLGLSAFVLACLSGLPNLKTVLAIEKLLDDGLPASQNMKQLEEDFPRGLPVMLLFGTRDETSLRHSDLLRIEDWSFEVQKKLGKDVLIQSPFQLRKAQWQQDSLGSPTLWNRAQDSQGLSFLRDSPWEGVLGSPKGDSLLMEFVFDREGPHAFENKDYEILKASASAFVASQPQLEFQMGGQGAFEYFSHLGLERNNLLNLILFAAIILMLRWTLGTWRGGAVFVMSVILSSLATLGLMGHWGAPLDLVSSGIVLMIAVAGLQDFLFVAQNIHAPGLKWRRAFRKILVPSFFTSFTTCAGFFSLMSSDLETISRFGLWAGVGALMEWIVTFLFLPSLLRYFPSLRTWTRPEGMKPLHWINQLLAKIMSRKWSLALLGFYVLGVWGAFHLDVTGAPKYMFTAGHDYVKGIETLRETRGWEDRAHLVVTGDVSEAQYSELLQSFRKMSNVSHLVHARQLSQYFVEDLPPPIQLSAESGLKSTQIWKDWAFPFHERVEIYLKETDLAEMRVFLAEAFDLCQQKQICYLAGPIVSQAEFAKKVPQEFMLSMALSLVAVALVLLWLLYARSAPSKFSWRFSMAALAGSLWAPAVIVFLYALFGIKVNFLACLFMSVMVGMTGDNCIQFIFSGRYVNFDEGVEERGGTSATISILVALACMIFVGSYFESPRVFGFFLGLGTLLSLVGDIWVVQGLKPQTTHKLKTIS